MVAPTRAMPVIKELPWPTDPAIDGAVGGRAFGVTNGNTHLSIMHSRKPHLSGGQLGLHISIAKSVIDGVNATAARVDDRDVRTVRRILDSFGLKWPTAHYLTRFDAGPFIGAGLHVWERQV